MNNVFIAVATHKLLTTPITNIYFPITSNHDIKRFGYIHEADYGDNISSRNSSFCELTAIYWTWKNAKPLVAKGICHYRRYFVNEAGAIMSADDITKILARHKIILPRKRFYPGQTIYSHYRSSHHIKDLSLALSILLELHPEWASIIEYYVNGSCTYLCNAFIAQAEIFDNYCEWVFPILFSLEEKIQRVGYGPYQQRVIGFIAERLFSIWVLANFSRSDLHESRLIVTENTRLIRRLVRHTAKMVLPGFKLK
jgi:hypothetical protein